MIKDFFSGLTIVESMHKPLRGYCDNSIIVIIAKNNKWSNQSRHIDIKYLGIRESVKDKKIIIEDVSTKVMLPDLLTKDTPQNKFKDHVVTIGFSPTMQFFIITNNFYETLFCMIFLVNCVNISLYIHKCH